jgi:hypothetical protein
MGLSKILSRHVYGQTGIITITDQRSEFIFFSALQSLFVAHLPLLIYCQQANTSLTFWDKAWTCQQFMDREFDLATSQTTKLTTESFSQCPTYTPDGKHIVKISDLVLTNT